MQMGEILAHATALFEECLDWRGDLGRLRIEGEIRSHEFQNKDGNKQNAYEIVAGSILTLRDGQRFTETPDPEPFVA